MPSRKGPLAKKLATLPPFAASHEVRHFVHADGRTYDIQVIDCRLYESWRNKDHGGGTNQSTRDSDEEAQTFAWSKTKGLLKKGYVEGPVTTGRISDPGADVVEVLRSHLDHFGKIIDDFRPVAARLNIFVMEKVAFKEWLVTRDDRRRAIFLRTKVHPSPLLVEEREGMANRFIDILEEQRDAIFADATTAVKKLALVPQVGPFTHLAVLSPMVVNRLVNGCHTVARSIYQAVPSYDCEFSAHDTVSVAEARTHGHGAMNTTDWHREPHAVLDLAYLKSPDETPKFLVYAPGQIERRLGGTLAKIKGTEILARNYAGDIRRFEKNQSPPDPAELRCFFGLPSEARLPIL